MAMDGSLLTLIIVWTGAVFYWALSGFRGNFDNYMSRYTARDSKYVKNLLTGMVIIVSILTTVTAIIKMLSLASS